MKTAITLMVTIVLTLGIATEGAYSKPPALSVGKDAPKPSLSELLLTGMENTEESYYQNFNAQKKDEYYELSGTLHQNKNPRSLIRVVLSPDAKLTVNGSITPVKGDVKLIYQSQDGLLVTLAEGKAGDGKPVSVSYDMQTAAGKGEFYIESTSAVCDFDLKFSTGDGIFYSLTNENPIGMPY